MNFIIGSGLIGRLAKDIFGPEWQFISHNKSRYFDFDPPLADNYIRINNEINHYFKSKNVSSVPLFYKKAFSYCGHLIYNNTPMTIEPYLNRIYGEDEHRHAEKLLEMTFSVYDLNVCRLYAHLGDIYNNNIKNGIGVVKNIDIKNRKLTILSKKQEYVKDYKNIISTIPLNVLNNAANIDGDLKARDVCYFHIYSDKVDLEGANEVMVCDNEIPFFKCSNLGKNCYMFWTFDNVRPYDDIGMIIGYDMDIMDSFRIEGAISIGSPPDLKIYEENGIYPVGSNAQWDDFYDISRCILKLLRLRNVIKT